MLEPLLQFKSEASGEKGEDEMGMRMRMGEVVEKADEKD